MTTCIMQPTVRIQPETNFSFRLKDPASALTHFIGLLAAILGTPILLIQASVHGADLQTMITLSVFMISMILLYGASTMYHSLNVSEKVNARLRKVDHMMIFVLIAGTYTPVCMTALRDAGGPKLLALVWGIAVVGMTITALWLKCPKWISSIIYISMGWVCILAFPAIYANFNAVGFCWLLAGGIIYTIGGILYACKVKALEGRWFGIHEVFHVFVMLGSFCHFMVMFQYIAVI
ncbi:MAG: hemolysin III family protein [Lachnospiraceae bacterium]